MVVIGCHSDWLWPLAAGGGRRVAGRCRIDETKPAKGEEDMKGGAKRRKGKDLVANTPLNSRK